MPPSNPHLDAANKRIAALEKRLEDQDKIYRTQHRLKAQRQEMTTGNTDGARKTEQPSRRSAAPPLPWYGDSAPAVRNNVAASAKPLKNQYEQSGSLSATVGPGTGRRGPYDSFPQAASTSTRSKSVPPERRERGNPPPEDDDPGGEDGDEWDEEDWNEEEAEEEEYNSDQEDDEEGEGQPRTAQRSRPPPGGGPPGYDPDDGSDSSDSSHNSDHSRAQSDGGGTRNRKRKPSSARVTYTRNIKEPDELRFTPLPSPQLWRTWRLHHFTYIQGVSNAPENKILKYLLKCDMTESEYPEWKLWRVPLSLRTLSPKITAACRKIMTGELGRRMTRQGLSIQPL